MSGAGWQVAAQTRDCVGEGALWAAAENAVYWVDILGPAINRLSLADGVLQRWPVPEPVGFIVPRRAGGFIVGLQSGAYRLRFDPFNLHPLGGPEPHLPGNRLNDGKVDAQGRLWAGTMAMDGGDPVGTLYRVDADLVWRSQDDGYRVTNGPAFTPAQDRLYHADTFRRVVYRFDLDGAGVLSGKMQFLRFPNDWGYPDGLTIDSEGSLWVAHWGGGRLSRFDPDGALERTINLPVSQITSCAFAGARLDRLFVTSARLDRDHESLAGALFEVETDVRGLAPGAFAG